MGPPSYMRPVVDRNFVMRRIPVLGENPVYCPFVSSKCYMGWPGFDRLASAVTGRRLTARLMARPQECFWRATHVSGSLARLSVETVKFLLWIFNGYSSSMHHPSYGFRDSELTVQWRLSTDTHDCLFFILTNVSTNKQFLHLHLACKYKVLMPLLSSCL